MADEMRSTQCKSLTMGDYWSVENYPTYVSTAVFTVVANYAQMFGQLSPRSC